MLTATVDGNKSMPVNTRQVINGIQISENIVFRSRKNGKRAKLTAILFLAGKQKQQKRGAATTKNSCLVEIAWSAVVRRIQTTQKNAGVKFCKSILKSLWLVT